MGEINGQRVELLKAAGTGYGTALEILELTDLPRKGTLLHITARLDATLKDMAVGEVVLSKVAVPTETTPDEDIAWRSASTIWTGHAVTADIDLDMLKAYVVRGARLWAVLNVTTAAGGGASTKLTLDVTVESG